METKEAIVTVEGGVGKITFSWPPLNVLNITFIRSLHEALKNTSIQNDARVVVIQGTGRAFCAGVDVADHTPEKTPEMIASFHSLIRTLWRVPVPTISLVHGAALGGGAELACACDMVLASENAKFGVPEIQLGVFPPIAIAEWMNAVGSKKAFELVMGGGIMTAPEALAAGLINRVFRQETFEAESHEYVLSYSKLSRAALVQAKSALNSATYIHAREHSLKTAEERYLGSLMKTHDASEGIKAFIEKRAPVWSHT